MDGPAAEMAGGFRVEWPHGLLLKARPAIEANKRFVYCEPSNENRDLEGQRVLQEGLAKAAPYFKDHGILDIGHFTLPGMADVARLHGFDPVRCRIGYPVEVRTDIPVMVKGRILSGEGSEFEYANYFYKTLEEGLPWFPSIGGEPGLIVGDGQGGTLIAPRWNNIGFWNEPVNPTVKPASTMPFDGFAKALTSGFGTDAATFTGGRALQFESLGGAGDEDAHYRTHALRYLRRINRGKGCEHVGLPLTVKQATAHFEHCTKLPADRATAYARRLIEGWHDHLHATAAQAA